jgi:lipopolysaccharide export system protein LptA
MKRRTFLAAVAPFIAAASSAPAQSPLGTAISDLPASPLATRPRSDAGTAVGGNAPADPKAKRAKGPTEITSREAMLDNRIHLATFSGEVDVKDPEYNLTCDKLTVHLKKPKAKAAAADAAKPGEPRPIGAEVAEAPAAKPAKKEESGSGIEKAIAEGIVKIVQEKVDANGQKRRYFGKAKRAVFDNDKKTCILYGWPRIMESYDEENEGKELVALQESTVITLDQAGVIHADGPNRVLLSNVSSFDEKENDDAKNKGNKEKPGNR